MGSHPARERPSNSTPQSPLRSDVCACMILCVYVYIALSQAVVAECSSSLHLSDSLESDFYDLFSLHKPYLVCVLCVYQQVHVCVCVFICFCVSGVCARLCVCLRVCVFVYTFSTQ